MEWRAEGLVLSSAKYGESDVLLEVLTEHKGRLKGFVKGGAGRRMRPVLQPGNRVDLVWRARTDDQLGRFSVEPIESPLGDILGDKDKLAALTALTATLSASLAERDAHPEIYKGVLALMTVIRSGDLVQMAAGQAQLELKLLADQGYGLDLSECALSGAREGLAFVSPKTGRAVTAAEAAPYKANLLILPPFLVGGGALEPQDALDALTLSAHFMARHIWVARKDGAPKARERMVALLHRLAD